MAGTLTTSTGSTSFNFLNNTRVPASGPGAPVHIKSRYAAPKASLHVVMDEPLVESTRNKSTSLYDVLNVKRNATPSEIKSAYRRLAKRCHPDALGAKKGGDRDFIDVHNAYVTLSDTRIPRRVQCMILSWDRVSKGGWECMALRPERVPGCIPEGDGRLINVGRSF